MTDQTTIVVGASRGIGRGIATAFAAAGGPVVAVSRTPADLPGIQSEVADAADPIVVADLVDRHDPDTIIVVAGATPHLRPLQQHTWETFSVNWHADVRIAFHWLREALLKPLRPGSRVVVFSSGAAVNGSPISGGYAGAKATQRFITRYAQEESDRAGLDITFTAVLPGFAPSTGVGRAATRAYAARAGLDLAAFLATSQPELTPQVAGAAICELVQADATTLARTYGLYGTGLKVLPE
jgi:NAD(P)-dependent dehydrogenase (short-subunit alcohol dehydrogenase family)